MDQESKINSIVEHLKRQIQSLAYDMRDERFDGWTKQYYRDCLIQLRNEINKALEK